MVEPSPSTSAGAVVPSLESIGTTCCDAAGSTTAAGHTGAVDGPGDVWYNVPASIVASQRPLRDRCFARACVMLCLQISNDEISVHADTLHYFSAHALRLP